MTIVTSATNSFLKRGNDPNLALTIHPWPPFIAPVWSCVINVHKEALLQQPVFTPQLESTTRKRKQYVNGLRERSYNVLIDRQIQPIVGRARCTNWAAVSPLSVLSSRTARIPNKLQVLPSLRTNEIEMRVPQYLVYF